MSSVRPPDEAEWTEVQVGRLIDYSFTKHQRYVCVIFHTQKDTTVLYYMYVFCSIFLVSDFLAASVILSAARASQDDAGVRMQEG